MLTLLDANDETYKISADILATSDKFSTIDSFKDALPVKITFHASDGAITELLEDNTP